MPETEIKSSFPVFLVRVITVSAAYSRQILRFPLLITSVCVFIIYWALILGCDALEAGTQKTECPECLED